MRAQTDLDRRLLLVRQLADARTAPIWDPDAVAAITSGLRRLCPVRRCPWGGDFTGNGKDFERHTHLCGWGRRTGARRRRDGV